MTTTRTLVNCPNILTTTVAATAGTAIAALGVAPTISLCAAVVHDAEACRPRCLTTAPTRACTAARATTTADGTYSCLYCSARHYNGRLIKDTDDECADGGGTPLYCICCGSVNTEYYDNNAFHCLDCDCWTHPGAQCPKCGGLYMSFQGDDGWQCLSCGTTFTDEKSVNMIRFTCHMFDADHEDDVNQQALIRKYAHKRKPAKKPDKPKE